MSVLHADLALVWYLLLAFVLLLVLLLDGLDLGVGILSLFVRQEEQRGAMMASVSTVWHANQTWLVVLGALLFGAFPLVYGLALSALYIPVALMLLGFVFRGVSLEYYNHAADQRRWGLAFGFGSLLATVAQGLALGTLLSGLPVSGERFSGGAWVWLSPFSFAATLGLLGSFLLSGAGWLVLKTSGQARERALRAARAVAFFLLIAAPVLILWSCRMHPFLTARWLSWPGLLISSLPLALATASFVGLVVSLARRWDPGCFWFALLTNLLILAALAGSIYPVIVPPGITVSQAVAGEINLEFMLVGVGILLPLMLAYNAYQYWIFRGKVEQGYGYE
ncbi:MAG: cytochrome d ubiquinol oxidase subunit II [Deltaproteobacteria bacterium]|nr:cytochrome d ubiquinol oxidase subunit II [Deltaproteobacteria bacterium]